METAAAAQAHQRRPFLPAELLEAIARGGGGAGGAAASWPGQHPAPSPAPAPAPAPIASSSSPSSSQRPRRYRVEEDDDPDHLWTQTSAQMATQQMVETSGLSETIADRYDIPRLKPFPPSRQRR